MGWLPGGPNDCRSIMNNNNNRKKGSERLATYIQSLSKTKEIAKSRFVSEPVLCDSYVHDVEPSRAETQWNHVVGSE